MIAQTQQQRDNTLYALNVMWPAIKPEQVCSSLGSWRCGTQACFGGHCAIDPYFQSQGLVADAGGRPGFVGFMGVVSGYGDETLFGDEDLFNVRGEHEADVDFEGTDHDIVTNRLQWLLNRSMVGT